MKFTIKLLVITVAIIGLSGCKQAHLGGPVADADILIDLLNQPGASFQMLASKDVNDVVRDVGISKWNSMTDNQKFIRLGSFEVDAELIDPGQLYFVTARYGEDTDANRNRKVDRERLEVAGEWHAIMSGATLLNDSALVSALTEAAYQYVRDRIGLVSDEELLGLLDEFAGLVVADVNLDGVVNYTDVLLWSRLYFQGSYLGDIAFLDRLADVITTGAADFVVHAAAESVWRNKLVPPVPPGAIDATGIGGKIEGELVLVQAMSPYSIDAALTINGDLVIEPGVWVRGNYNQIIVWGDLHIEGLPRQRITLDDVNITVSGGAGALISNADIDQSSLVATIQQLRMVDNTVEDSRLEIRTGRATGNNTALIQHNTLQDTMVTFYNRPPVREAFIFDFSNNLFIPRDSSKARLVSKWEGPVANLMIRNNSFHSNMRVLRSGYESVFNVAGNYWSIPSSATIDFDVVIPQSGEGDGDFTTEIIYLPRLKSPHPDTPRVP
jgi:hypothetical protein